MILRPPIKRSIELLQFSSVHSRRFLSPRRASRHVKPLSCVAQDVQDIQVCVGGQQHLRLFQKRCIDGTVDLSEATQVARQAQRASDIGVERTESIVDSSAYSFVFV